MQTVDARPEIRAVLQQYWGFDTLRPMQAEAIDAGLAARDSLVVLPTGGGKSLCYQVPPLVAGRTDIVVSPLIALMKDQVDGLRECGYKAAAFHSGQSAAEQNQLAGEVRKGGVRLVFVAPERLLTPRFLELLNDVDVRAFAIDEAHCISHWGHDFRPEYRRLAELKVRFPSASVHAFTATATKRVRDDIAEQLRLVDPTVLVGDFDRPNLIYRVVPRVDLETQVMHVLNRHRGEAVIIYCITRKETEYLASVLQAAGHRATCYHAGLEADDRRDRQERFAREELDIVVATVAFGMGIDRSDVRCVLHTAMPKSVEHYQQEAGRAGRDGLEAECVLLYSPADAQRWQGLVRCGSEKRANGADASAAQIELLGHMRGFASAPVCRHRMLVEYFGQEYSVSDCGACDVCLGETDQGEDATVLSQKILSCVARVEQRFGIGHVVKVLTGANDKFVRQMAHDELSTFGLLREMDKKVLTALIHQLVDLGLLDRTTCDRPLLKLNAQSWEVLRGEREVRLMMPRQRVVKATQVEAVSWDGVDRDLFESLRGLRRTIAKELRVPAYVIFPDATLRDMARRRPRNDRELQAVHGVGRRKAERYGERFLTRIRERFPEKSG